MTDWLSPNPFESVEQFSERIKRKYGLSVFRVYEDSQGHLKLDAIEVPRGERKRGLGAAAMRE